MPFMSLVTVCIGFGVIDEDYFLTPILLFKVVVFIGGSIDAVMLLMPLSTDWSNEYIWVCELPACTFYLVSAWFV